MTARYDNDVSFVAAPHAWAIVVRMSVFGQHPTRFEFPGPAPDLWLTGDNFVGKLC